jgi:hypothetical protein
MATSEQERRHYVEWYRSSGLTPVMFCKQHPIKVKTFYGWLKRYPCSLGQMSKVSPSLTVSRESLPPEDYFIPLKITDFEAGQDVIPEGDCMQSPCEDSIKRPLTLCFKTPHFCLDVSLNMDDHFSQFKLMLQAFQELT